MDKTSVVCVCVDTSTGDMTKITFALTAQFNFNLFCCLPKNETRGSHLGCSRILYAAANCCSTHSIWSGLLNTNGSESCQFVLNTDSRKLDTPTNSFKMSSNCTVPSDFMYGCYKHHCTHFPTVKSLLGA